ncbi:serine/threonine-protein kinase [Sinosporangium siamense]|uniref:serine/threonine-protein kinase n=1 Tax=Sinosporangium siamense TaxID=1367973 RepID=UPI00194E159E|nr:serine/threonine-protein kinase [Sinosporangium siamense]
MRLNPLVDGDPAKVGGYAIVGRLGVGGMGIVYAGVSANGARVAVKLVHDAVAADPEFRSRFAREVRVMRRVGGRCVVPVLDADPHAARPWMATEFVPGPTLDQRVHERRPLEGDVLFGLAAGLAEALRAIHTAGVVHRDLKPSNVILGPHGPRLLDFGIASTLDGTVLTRTGLVVGSPGWISPEEYVGEDAGGAADVYGWGLLVAYASSGRLPYGTARPEVLALRVMRDPVDTSAVPERLRELVDAALDKSPARRPATSELLASVADAWRRQRGQAIVLVRDDPAADITTHLQRTWAPPVAGSVAPWPAPETPWHARPLLWVAAGAAAVGVLGLIVAEHDERPRERSSVTSQVPGGRGAAVPPPAPIPAVPARAQPTTALFNGITLRVPGGWRLVKVHEDVACLESPNSRGSNGAWDYPCRPDAMRIETFSTPEKWPGRSIGDLVNGWRFDGEFVLPCFSGGTATRKAGLPARKANGDAAYGHVTDYDSTVGGKLLTSGMTSLSDGRNAVHRKWRLRCSHGSYTSRVWYLPKSQVAFVVPSVKSVDEAAFEQVVASANIDGLTRGPAG